MMMWYHWYSQQNSSTSDPNVTMINDSDTIVLGLASQNLILGELSSFQ